LSKYSSIEVVEGFGILDVWRSQVVKSLSPIRELSYCKGVKQLLDVNALDIWDEVLTLLARVVNALLVGICGLNDIGYKLYQISMEHYIDLYLILMILKFYLILVEDHI